jgi:aldose 1-epimerase
MNERSWVTGEQMNLTAGDYSATVVSLGGALRTLEYRSKPLILDFDADHLPTSGHGQLLAPWPNRLRDGEWSWRGEKLTLPVDEPHRGNSANHGLVRWSEWTIVTQEADAVSLTYRLMPRPGYPFSLGMEASYSLDPVHGLVVRLTATNLSSIDAPVALGAHPYLRPLGGGSIDTADLTMPAAARVIVDENGTPVGSECVEGSDFDFRTTRQLGAVVINNAFTDLERTTDGEVRVTLHDQDGVVTLAATSSARWLQVYTGDALSPLERRRAIAIEPMTAPPAALANGEGVAVLSPGASVSLGWQISARTIRTL